MDDCIPHIVCIMMNPLCGVPETPVLAAAQTSLLMPAAGIPAYIDLIKIIYLPMFRLRIGGAIPN